MDKIRGVNLGNWLVLEKWMGDSPLSESKVSEDDHDLVKEYANDSDLLHEKLEAFRSSYVTRDAIAWLKEQGCNMVRVPIPYHICGSEHHKSCSRHLNNLFDWCDELDVGILIDLHTVQYSQNGHDNGGYIGMCRWHQSADRVNRTLALLGRLASRYAGRKSFWGMEPLNEPATKREIENISKKHPDTGRLSSAPTRKFLMQFYEDFYGVLRGAAGPEVKAVLSDHYFLPAWDGFMSHAEGIVMDTHKYPCFKWYVRGKGLDAHIEEVAKYGEEIGRCGQFHPVIVGEWSLANDSTNGLSVADKASWERAYAEAQIDAWDQSLGGFFWSLRARNGGGWSFVDCCRNGWIDLRYGL